MKMKNKPIFIILMVILLAACKTIDDNENTNIEYSAVPAAKDSADKHIDSSINSMLDTMDLDEAGKKEVADALNEIFNAMANNSAVFNEKMQQNEDNMFFITPNPTSSHIDIELFHDQVSVINGEADKSKVVYDELTIELYYGNEKIHTFNFKNVSKSVRIGEEYLQRNGTYRIVANLKGIQLVRTFAVVRK
jgi:ribosomal protein L16 Arg81 hydroxylase